MPPRQDPWRPALHFSAERFWINDPNGLVHANGLWHLFFQHNPEGNTWGHMSWGHAVSRDLVHWEQLPLAIPEDAAHMIFSGSAVVDTDGSLAALYTACAQPPARHQAQHLARSHDGGVSWTKYAGNPVLDIGAADFRDPKVFWHEPDRRWVMAVVLPHEHQIRFYASTDLKQWMHLSDFGPAGSVHGIWECPDLFALPVKGQPGRRVWVLKVDVFEGHPAGGSGAQVFVGEFDGSHFRATQPAQWIDLGSDFYAAITWAHVPAEDGRTIWLGWMNSHRYAAATPTEGWCGAMSLPRELQLREEGGRFVLCQQPVTELLAALPERRRLGPIQLAAHDGLEAISLGAGDVLDLDVVWQPGTGREFGLLLRCGPQEATRIGWDADRGVLVVDRSQSGRRPDDPTYAMPQSAPLACGPDGTMRWRVLLDRCSVEVFADDGATVLTTLIFPSPQSLDVKAYAIGGTATLAALDWRSPGA